MFAKICIVLYLGNSGMSRAIKEKIFPFVPISEISGLAGMQWGSSINGMPNCHCMQDFLKGGVLQLDAGWGGGGGGL